MIPIMQPMLPRLNEIKPYFEQIDQNRWYSNFGPLVKSLENRFEQLFSLPQGGAITFSNGTVALTSALRALSLPRGSLCILPSWTFAATPASVMAAGLTPYFVDVDYPSGILTPERAASICKEFSEPVRAVVVVAPFGAAVSPALWDKFTAETGIPALIDAAAGFDTVLQNPFASPAKTPTMISLHATKIMGVGEGGLLVSSDISWLKRAWKLSNFGFDPDRSITVSGTNGKMSEYTAAVAHAALDNWPQTRKRWAKLRNTYKNALSEFGIARYQSDGIISATYQILLQNNNIDSMIASLHEQGIETRRWWGRGCHRQPAYAHVAHTDLTHTENLAQNVLSLPLHLSLRQSEISYISKKVTENIANSVRKIA